MWMAKGCFGHKHTVDLKKKKKMMFSIATKVVVLPPEVGVALNSDK